ncbi:MAG: hypothetical protein LBU32_15820 [Clostridiales bacterium]|jgi:hypothetical protein|nr:hypothetical protein [Clostridiales bacterium]
MNQDVKIRYALPFGNLKSVDANTKNPNLLIEHSIDMFSAVNINMIDQLRCHAPGEFLSIIALKDFLLLSTSRLAFTAEACATPTLPAETQPLNSPLPSIPESSFASLDLTPVPEIFIRIPAV